MIFAVIKNRLIHKGTIVIGIDTDHWERQIQGDLLQSRHNERLCADRHGDALRPAARNISKHQAMDEVAIVFGATTMLDHVDLEEPWRRVAPIGESPDLDTASNGRTYSYPAPALAVYFVTGFA